MNIFQNNKEKAIQKKLSSITLLKPTMKPEDKTTLRFHLTPVRTANIKKK